MGYLSSLVRDFSRLLRARLSCCHGGDSGSLICAYLEQHLSVWCSVPSAGACRGFPDSPGWWPQTRLTYFLALVRFFPSCILFIECLFVAVPLTLDSCLLVFAKHSHWRGMRNLACLVCMVVAQSSSKQVSKALEKVKHRTRSSARHDRPNIHSPTFVPEAESHGQRCLRCRAARTCCGFRFPKCGWPLPRCVSILFPAQLVTHTLLARRLPSPLLATSTVRGLFRSPTARGPFCVRGLVLGQSA